MTRPGEKIALVDYGMGNLRSVERAFARIGRDVRVTDSPAELRAADRIVLPGVGSARDCMTALRSQGLDDAIRAHIAAGRPYLGICLGLQTAVIEFARHVAGLASKSRVFATEVMCHPTLLALCDAALLPGCAEYVLNLGHIIDRGPGAQPSEPDRAGDAGAAFARVGLPRDRRGRDARIGAGAARVRVVLEAQHRLVHVDPDRQDGQCDRRTRQVEVSASVVVVAVRRAQILPAHPQHDRGQLHASRRGGRGVVVRLVAEP